MLPKYFDLTKELLHEYFDYDPNSGIMSWKKNRIKSLIGKNASSKKKDGYLQIHFKSVHYLTHRAIWLYVYGEHVTSFIDHINHDRSDNRLNNLRLVTKKQNNESRLKSKNKSSVHKGVSFRKDIKKWAAYICNNYKQTHLGYFDNELDAAMAYKEAALSLHTHNILFKELT